MRKYFIWYWMFTKRLLHKLSFWVILCLIPLLFIVANNVMSEESGVLKIALCCDEESSFSIQIKENLMNKKGIILFSECASRSEAVKKVENREVDAAWIFPENLEEKLGKYASNNKSGPVVEIVEREENVPLMLSKEILFGSLYRDLAFEILQSYVNDNMINVNERIENEIKNIFYGNRRYSEVVEIYQINSDNVMELSDNYLNTPLRGLLSLVVFFCTISAAVYFLKEKQMGKYDWIPVKKRIIPAFASCLSAAVISSASVLLALMLTDLSVSFLYEILMILILLLCSTGFCTVLCVCFNSPAKLVALIPGILIVSIVFTPIFFDITALEQIKFLLPTYYYVCALHKPLYCVYGIIYFILSLLIAVAAGLIVCKYRKI